MTIINKKEEIKEFQSILYGNLKLELPHTTKSVIHVLASQHELDILHNAKYWYSYSEIKSRHLNSFGLVVENHFSTKFQLSIPIEGINSKLGGLFAKNKAEVHVLYRGFITGKTGISKRDFLSKYNGQKVVLNDDIYIDFGIIGKDNILRNIIEYVDKADYYKSNFRIENK